MTVDHDVVVDDLLPPLVFIHERECISWEFCLGVCARDGTAYKIIY